MIRPVTPGGIRSRPTLGLAPRWSSSCGPAPCTSRRAGNDSPESAISGTPPRAHRRPVPTKNPIALVELVLGAPLSHTPYFIWNRTPAATRHPSPGNLNPSKSLDRGVCNSSTPVPGTFMIEDVCRGWQSGFTRFKADAGIQDRTRSLIATGKTLDLVPESTEPAVAERFFQLLKR